MRSEPEFAIRVAALLGERRRQTSTKLEAMRFRNAGQRICPFLLPQEEEAGRKNLDITQAALETINRRQTDMASAGAITREPGRITLLDSAMLRARLIGT